MKHKLNHHGYSSKEAIIVACCLVCGKYEEISFEEAMKSGWVFTKCPECQRGIPFDILVMHMLKTIPDKYIEGYCPEHWFKDSGICAYCKMKRETFGVVNAYSTK